MSNLTKLEELTTRAEQISCLLGMLDDCTAYGAFNTQKYQMGINLLFILAYENSKALNDFKDRMFNEAKEEKSA